MLPVAILCGGNGTRANLSLNKCFVEVAGKPLILRIMDNLEKYGYTTFVLCRGTDGTLTALRNAREQLGPRFLVLYGDTFLPLDAADFVDTWERSGKPAIGAVTPDGIDASVNGFSLWMLDMVDGNDLDDLKAKSDELGLTCKYTVFERWHEVGSPEALAETREWFS